MASRIDTDFAPTSIKSVSASVLSKWNSPAHLYLYLWPQLQTTCKGAPIHNETKFRESFQFVSASINELILDTFQFVCLSNVKSARLVCSKEPQNLNIPQPRSLLSSLWVLDWRGMCQDMGPLSNNMLKLNHTWFVFVHNHLLAHQMK